jgi:hypothetical protein
MQPDNVETFYDFIKENYSEFSQNRQDLLALYFYRDRPGVFVECGALDGIDLSNTYLLEKEYGWTGLLVEPLPSMSEWIRGCRSSPLDTRCLSDVSGEMAEFYETKLTGLSTLAEFAYTDNWVEERKNHIVHQVLTVSLKDLLLQHDMPRVVDYFSLDTEGSEFLILNAFDFSTRFNLITVEHNNTPNQGLVYELLSSNNYIRIFPELSGWEDWYAHRDFLEERA